MRLKWYHDIAIVTAGILDLVLCPFRDVVEWYSYLYRNLLLILLTKTGCHYLHHHRRRSYKSRKKKVFNYHDTEVEALEALITVLCRQQQRYKYHFLDRIVPLPKMVQQIMCIMLTIFVISIMKRGILDHVILPEMSIAIYFFLVTIVNIVIILIKGDY